MRSNLLTACWEVEGTGGLEVRCDAVMLSRLGRCQLPSMRKGLCYSVIWWLLSECCVSRLADERERVDV